MSGAYTYTPDASGFCSAGAAANTRTCAASGSVQNSAASVAYAAAMPSTPRVMRSAIGERASTMPAPAATDAAGPMIQYDSIVVPNESTSSAAGNGNAVHATSVVRGAVRSATNHVTPASSRA